MNANNTRAALVDRLFTTWRRCTAWSAKLAVALVAVSALFGVVQPGLSQPAVAQAYTFQGPDKVGYGRAVILSVTGLAGPVWSQNVRFEWLHRDSPGRLCQV